jgi:hypothetical protein
MIRAAVRRDGPGEWSFTVVDGRGEIVAGVEDSWADAYRAATAELATLGATEPADPGVVVRGRWSTTVQPTPHVCQLCGISWHNHPRQLCRPVVVRRPLWRRWLAL